MKSQVRWSLSLMMFLEYAAWGAWFPDLSVYMSRIGFSDSQNGVIYSLLPLGCMLAPFIAGQIADRYFSSERMMLVLHLASAILMFSMARMTSYSSLWPLMFAWSLAYAPTLSLTNSLSFHHMPEAEKEFSLVRVWGTIGWIVVGLLLSKVLRGLFPGLLGGLGGSDSLWLSGFLSLLLAIYSLALPHTPPARKGGTPWAFLAAVKMLRDPQFAIFIAITFVVATELMFYFVLTAPFLESVGVTPGQAPAWMTIAQAAEILTMLALPWMMTRWGLRKTMLVGILAWPLRYAVFAVGHPLWLVLAALSLHGLCYVCFLTASFIYVNQVASSDIRASAQGLITFVTLGAGMWVGSLFAGYISENFSVVSASGVKDYTRVFLVPLVLTVICAVVFMLTFREKSMNKAEAQAAA